MQNNPLAPRFRRTIHASLLAGTLVLAFGTDSLQAANGSWTSSANGNWSDTTRWESGIVGDGAGATVNFTNDIPGDIKVTVDGSLSRTMGILNIGGPTSTRSYTFVRSGTESLIFDTGSAANAQMHFFEGQNAFQLPIFLASSLDLNNHSDRIQSLQTTTPISASTSGTKLITNQGNGMGAVALGGVISDGSGVVAIRQNSATSQLSITGVNTYSGGTVLDAGVLAVTGAGALGSGTLVINGGTLRNGATGAATVSNAIVLAADVDLEGTTGGTTNTTRLVLSGDITMTDSRTVTVNEAPNAAGGGYVQLQSSILESGTGGYSLTKEGAGVLVISLGSGKSAGYTGGTFVNGGTLRLATSSRSSLSATGSVTVNGGTLDAASLFSATEVIGPLNLVSGAVIGSSGTSTLIASSYVMSSGTVSKALGGATSALTKKTSGTVALSGANTYGGTTTINEGVLSVSTLADGGVASGIGNSSASASNLVLNGGTLQYTGVAATTNRNFQVGASTVGDTGTIDASGTGALGLSGTAAYGTADQSRSLVLTGTNTGANTLSGAIGNNGTGLVSLTKNGSGRWVLRGVNSYTGETTVNSGELPVAGSISGNQNITVNAAGTLNLGGMSSLTVASGKAIVANGTVTGPSGGLSIGTGAALSGTGTISSALAVNGLVTPNTDGAIGTLRTGALTLSGAYKLDLNSTSGAADLILATGFVTLGGTLEGGFDLGSGGFGSSIAILESSVGISGSFTNSQVVFDSTLYDIDYTGTQVLLTAVPEPTVWSLGLAGLGMLFVIQRKRRIG